MGAERGDRRPLAQGQARPVCAGDKCVARVGPGPNDIGGSRKHIIESCERSLRRLGTDRVDLFYLHRSDVRDGKALYFGVSNFSAWQVALLLEIIARERLSPPTAVQDRHNLVCRRNERDLYPLANAKGLGLLACNPIGVGMLAGLFKRGDRSGGGTEARCR